MNKELYELSYTLKKELQQKILSIFFTLFSIFLVINLILSFLIFPVRQVSVSMESDISKNSCILFSPLVKKCERGDVVLVKPRNKEKKTMLMKISNTLLMFVTARQFSMNNIENLSGNEYQIRRIVALPGDTIYMRDYIMYIKPSGENFFLTEFELVDKSYNINILTNPANWDNTLGVVGSFDEITLGSNEYFVLGDSRNCSFDSRMWGTLSKDDIKASAIFQYIPINKIRLF